MSVPQGVAWVKECIDQLLPVAREHDIILGLENHYKDGYWRYPEFAQRMDVFLQVLDAIPERALRRAVRPVQRHRGGRRPRRTAAAGGGPRSACTPATATWPQA
ncbi:MAG: hypothetical protein R2854_08010 [Caldilineaceae bacterium]